MASWSELLDEFPASGDDAARIKWITDTEAACYRRLAEVFGTTNIITYATAFLQKPAIQQQHMLQITAEDINGFMACVKGLDWDQELVLVLHTPGGVVEATETVVSYLRDKFKRITVVVPAYAMSAGTMICMGANRVLMGCQSQLGPIDPQLNVRGRFTSSYAIVEQFDKARSDILTNPVNAHLYAPILSSYGPALHREAKSAIEYGRQMVVSWLRSRMFADAENPDEAAEHTAEYFSSRLVHQSHGARIDLQRATSEGGLVIENFDSDQELQDAVLSLYHLTTLIFDNSPTAKLVSNYHATRWIKNHQ